MQTHDPAGRKYARRKTDGPSNILTNRGFGFLTIICALAAATVILVLLFGCAAFFA